MGVSVVHVFRLPPDRQLTMRSGAAGLVLRVGRVGLNLQKIFQASAVALAAGAYAPEPAVSYSSSNLGPLRLTARFDVLVEHLASYPRLGEELTRDLREGVRSALDSFAVVGSATISPQKTGVFQSSTSRATTPGSLTIGSDLTAWPP